MFPFLMKGIYKVSLCRNFFVIFKSSVFNQNVVAQVVSLVKPDRINTIHTLLFELPTCTTALARQRNRLHHTNGLGIRHISTIPTHFLTLPQTASVTPPHQKFPYTWHRNSLLHKRNASSVFFSCIAFSINAITYF